LLLLLPTGIDVGGNNAHLAPEILNARSGPRKFINYSKQPVWAAGVLAYEFAGHKSPPEQLQGSHQRLFSDIAELIISLRISLGVV